MADFVTANFDLVLPTVGDEAGADQWGDKINANLVKIDEKVPEAIASSLNQAKTYTDNAATDTLEAANTYTNTTTAGTLEAANAYTDTTTADTLTAAQMYADGVGSAVSDTVPGLIDTAIDTYDAALFDATHSERWHGADSIVRTRPSKFGDTVDLADFFDVTGSDASGASNALQLAKLITYLNANPTKTTLVGRKQDIVRLDTTVASNFAFPNTGKFRVRLEGALFDVSALQGTYSGAYIEFPYADIEGINIRLRDGTTFRRLIQFTSAEETPCITRDIFVAAETQINNQGASPLLDYALRFYGSGHRSRNVKTKNVDWALLLYGDVEASPTISHRIEDWSAESYCNAITFRNLTDTILKTPSSKVRSVNGSTNPGHNSFLGSALKDFTMVAANFQDAPEHSIRMGGSRGVEQWSHNLTFIGSHIARAGQTGMKFFTGTAGQRFYNLNVIGANIIDCQYEPELPLELPGFNDEGVLAQQITGGSFCNISVDKRDSITGYSCDCGFFGSGLVGVNVDGLRVNAPYRSVLRLDQYDDGAGVGHIETISTNGFKAVGIFGDNVRGDGIFFNFPTQNFRDIDIEAKLIGAGTAGTYGINGSGAVARYAQPVAVSINARNFPMGVSGLPQSGNNNLRLVDTFALPQRVGSVVYDAVSIPAGSFGAPVNITASGAAVGDTALVSGPGEAVGIMWIGRVSAVNTVTAVPINTTAGAVDPPSGTVRVRTFPAA